MATHPPDHSGTTKLSLVRDRRHRAFYDTVVLERQEVGVVREVYELMPSGKPKPTFEHNPADKLVF